MFQNTPKRREFTPKANLPPKYPDLNQIKPDPTRPTHPDQMANKGY
jgi:hypothetical protein